MDFLAILKHRLLSTTGPERPVPPARFCRLQSVQGLLHVNVPHRKDEEIQATGERAVRTKETHKQYQDISNSSRYSVEFYGYADIYIDG
jgi:hypothetical protein